jgi:hypothetical protein
VRVGMVREEAMQKAVQRTRPDTLSDGVVTSFRQLKTGDRVTVSLTGQSKGDGGRAGWLAQTKGYAHLFGGDIANREWWEEQFERVRRERIKGASFGKERLDMLVHIEWVWVKVRPISFLSLPFL